MGLRSKSMLDSKLTRKRHELGATQAEVAKCIGIPASTYGSWELGLVQSTNSPTFNLSAGLRLCELYDISMDELDFEFRSLYAKRMKGGNHEYIYIPPKTDNTTPKVTLEPLDEPQPEGEDPEPHNDEVVVNTSMLEPFKVCNLPRSEVKYVSVDKLLEKCYGVVPYSAFKTIKDICDEI